MYNWKTCGKKTALNEFELLSEENRYINISKKHIWFLCVGLLHKISMK